MKKTAIGGLFCHAVSSDRHLQRPPAQMMRVMRMLTVLLFVAGLSAAASGTSQTITLSGNNLPIKTIFAAIEKQTGYAVGYRPDLFATGKTMSIAVKQLPLEAFLAMLLQDAPIAYDIQGKTIFLSKKSKVVSFDQPVSLLQSITGRVLHSANGAPLAGATIANIQTGQTTISTEDGHFTLQFAKGQELKISYVGFQELFLRRQANGSIGLSPSSRGKGELSGDSTSLKILMTPAESNLSEVVVNKGYYTESQRLSTGNVARVLAKDISNQPVTNPLAALQGRVPGMLVTPTSGIPGGAVNIEIRGRTAIDQNITSDQPLFVIDGVPFSNGNGSLQMEGMWSAGIPHAQVQTLVKGGVSPFQGINPQDIESIEVLKDADATAIYGSRGANGVILITTKRGKVGKATISINTYQGVSFVKDNVKMMSTAQYLEARRMAFKNSNQTMTPNNAPDILVWDTTLNFNYADIFTNNVANAHNSQVSFAGGNKLTQFSIRGGYHRENTIMDADHKSERVNFSFSLNQKSVNEKLNVLFAASFGNNVNDLINQDMSRFRILTPNMRLVDDDGKPIWEAHNTIIFNPFAERLKRNSFVSKSLYANVQPSYQLSKRLKASVNLGYNYLLNDQIAIVPLASIQPGSTLPSSRDQGNSRNQNWSLEPQLDYKQELFGGDLNLLLGSTIHITDASSVKITARDFANDEALRRLNNALSYFVTEASSQYKYLAAFGRVNYNYRNTYLVNFTARRDGSSRFGSGKRFSNFGAVGAAWLFTNALNMNSAIPWLSFGKLRGSIGLTGNDKIPDYQYLDTWSVSSFVYPQLNAQYLYPDKLFNPEYHWESTKKVEIALEFGLFNDRVLFSPVFFHNISSNELVNYKLPRMTGFNAVVANLPAKVVNAGFEFSLSGDLLRRKDFTWHAAFNFSVPRNKLKEFPGIENSSYYTTYVVGKPLNVIYTFDFTGVDPQTGDPTFRDVNKDGKINTEDYVANGTLNPKYYGGLQNSLTYKNFQLDFFVQFRNTLGGNHLRFSPVNTGNFYNWPVTKATVWKNPGDVADIPKYISSSTTANNNFKKSNAIYSDASYLRLNNISFSYRIPDRLIHKLGISTLRFYVLGQNLFTISGYEVGDPEIQSYLSTPALRTITGGLQLTF